MAAHSLGAIRNAAALQRPIPELADGEISFGNQRYVGDLIAKSMVSLSQSNDHKSN
jgi:hypothetical protein